MKLFLILALCCVGWTTASGQPWAAFLDPSRATRWDTNGVGATITNRTTACATQPTGMSTGGTAAANSSAIQTAIVAANGGNCVINLPAGTYNWNGNVTNNYSGFTIRGNGTTLVAASGAGYCGGGNGGNLVIGDCNSGGWYVGSAAVQPGGANAATVNSGYTQGSTSIVVGSIGSSGISVGQLIVMDQANLTTDNSGIYTCDQVTTPQYCRESSQTPSDNGRTISGIDYNGTQMFVVTAVTGSGATRTLTLSNPIYGNNWASGQTPGIWWPSTVVSSEPSVYNIGVENITFDYTANSSVPAGISFYDCYNCWATGIQSKNANRDHVWVYQSKNVTIADSYFFGTQNAASESYGVEDFISSDALVQNNIFQQVAEPLIGGGGSGWVEAYNFWINNRYGVLTSWNESAFMGHDAGNSFKLLEGNEGNSIFQDDIHGIGGGSNTVFRNQLSGRGYNCTVTSGTCTATALTTNNTSAMNIYYGARGHNVIGNVLGTASYHTTYQTDTTGSTTNCNASIFVLGWGAATCTVDGGGVNYPQKDTLVESTLMRWDNYDVATNAVRQFTSEGCPGAGTYLNANCTNFTTPSTTIPASLYLSAKPSWWNFPSGSASPFPAVGPDVTGGTITAGTGPNATLGGHAYPNPAMNMYFKVMSGPTDGSGTMLTGFNPALYYTSSTAANPTFSPPAGTYSSAQTVVISSATPSAFICYNTTGSAMSTASGTSCTNGTHYTGPVTVPSSETLYAIAGATGLADSSQVSAPYSIWMAPLLPTIFTDNNEALCPLTSNCYPGSPGLSATAPSYTLTVGGGSGGGVWSPSAPCGLGTSRYTADSAGTGIQNAFTDVEACRTSNHYGIIIQIPPGTYANPQGFIIPQTASSVIAAPIIVRSTQYAALAAAAPGLLVGAGGIQDNVSASVNPGLNNPDLTGGNMYYVNGPTNGNGTASPCNQPNVICGITTVSVNTLTLGPIATGTQLVNLKNGYVSPNLCGLDAVCTAGLTGITKVMVDTGANLETVTPLAGPNQSGLYATFTKSHAAGVPVTYQPTSTGAFKLANGTPTFISNYNYLQYMVDLQVTAATYVPLQLCTAPPGSAPTSQSQCGSTTTGPFWWELDGIVFQLCPGLYGAGAGTCPGANDHQGAFVAGQGLAGTFTSMAQLPSHIHLNQDAALGDWTSLQSGTNGNASGFNFAQCQNCSLMNSQVSQVLFPGTECHALDNQGDQIKFGNDWLEGCSVSTWMGGGEANPPNLLGYSANVNTQEEKIRDTFPYPWLGTQGYNDGNPVDASGCTNGGGNIPDRNPYWGSAGGNFLTPTYSLSIGAGSGSGPYTYTVTLSGSPCGLTSSWNVGVGAAVQITGVTPSGFNGPYQTVSSGAGTFTITTASLLSYTSGGKVAVTGPGCGGSDPNVTCINVDTTGTQLTWVSGPLFHDWNSIWATAQNVHINNDSGTYKLAAVTSGSGTCSWPLASASPTPANSGCPLTLPLKSPSVVSECVPGGCTNVPFYMSQNALVKKNTNEMKEGSHVLVTGLISENSDNSGGQDGIGFSMAIRSISGKPTGANYLTALNNVTIQGLLSRNLCNGFTDNGGRSGSSGNGDGVSYPLNFAAYWNALGYAITNTNPGCNTDSFGTRIDNGNQSWNVVPTQTTSGSVQLVAVASVDAGVAVVAAGTAAGGNTTYTTTGSTAAANALICGGSSGAYVLVSGFGGTGNGGTPSTANNSTSAGFQCVSSTASTLVLANASGVAEELAVSCKNSQGAQFCNPGQQITTPSPCTTGTPCGVPLNNNANPVFSAGSPSGLTLAAHNALVGYEVLDFTTGDPSFVSGCVGNTAFNQALQQVVSYQVAAGIAPLASSSSAPWTGNYTTGYETWTPAMVTINYPWTGTTSATDTSGSCILANVQGGPSGALWSHQTLLTDATGAITPINNGSNGGFNFMANSALTDNIIFSNTSSASGWYNLNTNTPHQGLNTESVSYDATTLSAWGNVFFSGSTSYASDYAEFANNPAFPAPSTTCSGGSTVSLPKVPIAPATAVNVPGCTPPSANWSFPLSSCAIGFIGTGTWANGCTGSLVPLNAPDYHFYGLAGGPYNSAPDNSSLPIGAVITGGAATLSIDYLQTTNLYPVAGCPNGTTSCPFPDVLSGGTTYYNLTVSVTGTGSVSSSPAGISGCTGTCSASFASGTVVTLTVNSGTLTAWSGGCSGSGGCSVTMSATESVGAAFTTPPSSPTNLIINGIVKLLGTVILR